MGNCCGKRSQRSYSVAAYNVEDPERVRVHSFAEETLIGDTQVENQLKMAEAHQKSAVPECLDEVEVSLEHPENELVHSFTEDICSEVDTPVEKQLKIEDAYQESELPEDLDETTSIEEQLAPEVLHHENSFTNEYPDNKINTMETLVPKSELSNQQAPGKRKVLATRKSVIAQPEIPAIPESISVAFRGIEVQRSEVLVRERGLGAAPPPAKRAISVEAKSSSFIVDVPQLESLGPDGSFMVAF